MSESSKSVSVPSFNGKNEEYEMFWIRFQAYASLKGFEVSIDPEQMDVELPVKYNEFDNNLSKFLRFSFLQLLCR